MQRKVSFIELPAPGSLRSGRDVPVKDSRSDSKYHHADNDNGVERNI